MKEKIGKKENLEKIFKEYSDMLLSKLLKKYKDENLVKDVIAETFERFRKWNPLIKGKSETIGRWLFTTAKHIAIDYLRERNKDLPLTNENISDSSPNPEEIFIKRSEYDKIMEISKRFLNENLYEIYELYFLKGLPIKEIAQKKNTTEGAIKKSIFKIRRIIYERAPKSIKEKYLKRR